MTTSACPTCGATRTIADREPDAVIWVCGMSGMSRERLSEGESL